MTKDKRFMEYQYFIIIHSCVKYYIAIKIYCSNHLSNVIPAFVEPVDPENVDVREALPLADGNRGVRDGNYSF